MPIQLKQLFRYMILLALIVFATPQTWASLTSASPCQNFAKVNVLDFGAVGNNTTDNVLPFQNALAYASKCSINTVYVPTGNYNFVPATSPRGIFISSNTTLQGDGIGKSNLNVSKINPALTFSSFFWAYNQDNIVLTDLSFNGNGVVLKINGKPDNQGGIAFFIIADKLNTRPLNRFLVQRSSFKNFTGYAWIAVFNNSTNYAMNNIDITTNTFTSLPGNNGDPSIINYEANAIAIQGSEVNTVSLVTNVIVTANTIDASHIKGGLAIWSGVSGANITNNTILNAGSDANVPFETGAYAINVYSNAYEVNGQGIYPDMIVISHNNIVSPKSCGVYVASANRIWVQNNAISGQYDTDDRTLLKGAIAINEAESATVTGNIVTNSYFGIEGESRLNGGLTIQNNTITNIRPGGTGISLILSAAYSVTQVYDNKIDGANNANTTGIHVRNLGGYIYLTNIVEMRTTVKTHFTDKNQADVPTIAAMNALSPWGVKISNVWSCPTFAPTALQIPSVNPTSYGCTTQSSF